MENIKSNYWSLSDIEGELKGVVIENFLDFDVNEKYEFAQCEDCNENLKTIIRGLEDSKKLCGQERKRKKKKMMQKNGKRKR